MPVLERALSFMRFSPLLCLLALASPALADPATEMRRLGNCADCVIEGGDFTGKPLMGIDLSKATVSGTDFSQSDMTIAVLDGARLEGVSFAGANLRGATFVGARLTGVDFAGANLTGAVFEGAVLVDSDLTAGRLCNTQLPDDAMANQNCGN